MEAAQASSPISSINPSQKVLRHFGKAIKESHAEIEQLLHHCDKDVTVPTTLTEHGDYMSWTQFLSKYQLNGQTFIDLLEPLMDLETEVCKDGDSPMTLREFGDDNYLLKLDMLLGDTPDAVVIMWVHFAMFLARHSDRDVPTCMRRPVSSQAVSSSSEQR